MQVATKTLIITESYTNSSFFKHIEPITIYYHALECRNARWVDKRFTNFRRRSQQNKQQRLRRKENRQSDAQIDSCQKESKREEKF